jgi:antitoxin HicB
VKSQIRSPLLRKSEIRSTKSETNSNLGNGEIPNKFKIGKVEQGHAVSEPDFRYYMRMIGRLPLVFTPQPEGGFTVTSPVLPELITEGDTLDEAYANVRDALAAVLEIYSEEGRPLPAGVELPQTGQIVWADALVEVA